MNSLLLGCADRAFIQTVQQKVISLVTKCVPFLGKQYKQIVTQFKMQFIK